MFCVINIRFLEMNSIVEQIQIKKTLCQLCVEEVEEGKNGDGQSGRDGVSFLSLISSLMEAFR